jgi:hypothetical protein
MPITPFLRSQAFEPETLEAMGSAFVATCEALGLSDRADPMTKLVAQKIGAARIQTRTALHLAEMKEFKSAQ